MPPLVAGALDLAVVEPARSTIREVRVDAAVRRGLRARRADDHPLAAHDGGDASPSSPTTSCCSAPAGHRASASTSTGRRGGRRSTLRAQAELDGVRLMASLAFEGFGPAVAARPAPCRLAHGRRGGGSTVVGCRARRSAWPAAVGACPPRPAVPWPTRDRSGGREPDIQPAPRLSPGRRRSGLS